MARKRRRSSFRSSASGRAPRSGWTSPASRRNSARRARDDSDVGGRDQGFLARLLRAPGRKPRRARGGRQEDRGRSRALGGPDDVGSAGGPVREEITSSGPYKQRHQRVLAALRAPVPVQLRIERSAFGQRVGRIEMLPRLEHAAAAVLQADLHLSRQNEYPLRLGRAVPLAPEADRAVAQLVAGGRQDFREHRLRRAFGQLERLLAEPGAAVLVREQNYFAEGGHGPAMITAGPMLNGRRTGPRGARGRSASLC